MTRLPKLDFCAAHSFDSFEKLGAYHEAPREGHRYGRDSNSVVQAAEQALEAFEPDTKAVLFNSGMSAASALLDVLVKRGWTLALPGECYRKLDPLTECRGWPVVRWNSIDELRALPAGPLVIWTESPSNPHLTLADYEGLFEIRHERGYDKTMVVGDLTFAGLENWKGYRLFDAVLHSATKYISGHNDFIAGVVFAREDIAAELWKRRSYGGGLADPMTAYMLCRSLETYRLRINAQLANVSKVLDWLSLEQTRVFYPENFEAFHVHGGAVVSFLRPSLMPEALTDLVSSLKVIKMAPSFGAVHSMIEVPATMSHYGKDARGLAEAGIEQTLVRLSVGCEPFSDIKADLDHLWEI